MPDALEKSCAEPRDVLHEIRAARGRQDDGLALRRQLGTTEEKIASGHRWKLHTFTSGSVEDLCGPASVDCGLLIALHAQPEYVVQGIADLVLSLRLREARIENVKDELLAAGNIQIVDVQALESHLCSTVEQAEDSEAKSLCGSASSHLRLEIRPHPLLPALVLPRRILAIAIKASHVPRGLGGLSGQLGDAAVEKCSR